MKTSFTLCTLLLSCLFAATAQSDELSFNRDIRPLLSDRCYSCHGPDEAHREADLRLDKFETAHESAIVAGEPDSSEMVERITSTDADYRMPPPESGKSLSPEEIAILKRWITAGGKYEKHWAFIAPRRHDPPKSPDSKAWSRNPIDDFVHKRMLAAGLSPSPESKKETLIRRVTLDLTGLPPTPKQVTEFVADQSPNAYEKVVDRLLASTAYGERMAQVWLDAARYADTMGYQADWERYQWRWREWVIDAYNRNLPFDQFTIEQLAGDLLPDASVEQMIATGFNRNHRINDEAGIIPEEYLVEYIVDRVETTSATWLGLTMGCARCHDHKFDPISQEDFYSVFAFFNGVPEKGKEGRKGYADPYLRVAVRCRQGEYESLKDSAANLDRQLKQFTVSDESLNEWAEEAAAILAAEEYPWETVNPTRLTSNESLDFERQEDGSFLVAEKTRLPTYTVEIKPTSTTLITGIQLEALTHPVFNGRLSTGNGNIVLTEFSVAQQLADSANINPIKIAAAYADYAQNRYPVSDSIDGRKNTGWAVDGNTRKQDRRAVYRFAEAVEVKPGDKLIVNMEHTSRYPNHSIGRFRLSLTSTKAPGLGNNAGFPTDIAKRLQMPHDSWSRKDVAAMRNYYRTVADETAELRADATAAKDALKQFEKDHTTYVMVMREMKKPRETFVLNRGVYNQPAKQVTAKVPATLLGDLPDGAPANRLGFARWLVSGQHPLTARVVVNRYWAMLFGNGLVPTVEDFGLQGEYPTHPQLLDWLATEYPRLGWDTKELLKLIVNSATYRQSSKVTPESDERDPQNRLLSRMSRVRLPAESIRDLAVFASGKMNRTIGGPSVKPYQPDGLWREISFQDKKRSTDFYVQDKGDKLYRRSLYTFWKRSVPPPSMSVFDAPSREACVLRRSTTNTPLQALTLMNDVTFVEASRLLAERTLLSATVSGKALAAGGRELESGPISSKQADIALRFAFATLLSRQPSESELAILQRGYSTRRQYFEKNPKAAESLIAVGDTQPDKSLPPVDLATMSTCVMNILNLDETITRE
ncbi:MAG: PSD1 and planctomycete cytochrome C domain-containing protein [Planctomycetota bacterium]